MAPEPKVSDEDLARLRRLHDDEGWSVRDLADAFGISRQHAGRLLRGEQRPTIAGLDADAVRDDVVRAVDEFLAGADLDAGGAVLAAAARALALKLDACASSQSAAAASATPRIAAALVDVLAELRAGEPHEPDDLDHLRQRRAARRLAVAATAGRR